MANKPPLPKVQLSRTFHAALLADGAKPETMIECFAEWKRGWPALENADYYFGKDGYYFFRELKPSMVLQHVHMPPEDPNYWPASSPPLSLAERNKILKEIWEWDLAWDQGRGAQSRTSSRVLVYVDGKRHGYLLLHLAREPNGHDETTANKRLRRDLTSVAEAFIHNGTILI